MFNDSFRSRYKTVPIAISENKTCFPTRPHNHNEIEMLLICQGRTEIRINGECFQARTGDLIFVSPLEVHSFIADRSVPYYHRCICIDGSLIGNKTVEEAILSGSVSMPRYIPADNPHNRYLVSMFDQLYEASQQEGDLLSMEVPAYSTLLLAYLIKHNLLVQNRGKNKNMIFCGRVHRYISENYQLDITSRQVAEALNFNHSYFCRAFKKHFDMTFSEYLNFYRISASKKLIEDGEKNIAYIACVCGFTNPEYFSRSFKKYLGMMPREYKKSIQY